MSNTERMYLNLYRRRDKNTTDSWMMHLIYQPYLYRLSILNFLIERINPMSAMVSVLL